MPPSEAYKDAPRELVRIAFPHYTGHLGTVRGVDLVDGVAQNGCTLAEAERLRGIMGPALTIVGPWAPLAPAAPAEEPPPVEAPPPPEPPPARKARR